MSHVLNKYYFFCFKIFQVKKRELMPEKLAKTMKQALKLYFQIKNHRIRITKTTKG